MTASFGGSALFFAGFASFGLVLELLIVKKQLLSGCEDKISATVRTLQYPVLEFHGIPF